MAITQAVIDATRERVTFDIEQLREEMKSKTPLEANSAERVKDFLSTGAEQARIEGVALERILGGNDLQQINYLERGIAAARSVGRVNVVDPSTRNLVAFGTGFLIGPNLLLTNNHVLASKAIAAVSFVEFNYQLDVNGTKTVQDAFELDANACYITNVALDFTVVGVKSKSDRNVDLSKYGFLKLDPTPGKALDAHYLTVIQHPSGQRKQIAIRENQLIKTQTDTLWYATDTAPGSSGSCVFNDAWQVVALHHSGIPKTDAAGNFVTTDGRTTTDLNDPAVAWIANEGIRISSIVAELRKSASNKLVAGAVGAPEVSSVSNIVLPTPGPGVTVVAATAEKISIDPNYDNRHGYDPAFLGTGNLRVALPKLTQPQLAKAALTEDGEHVLNYHHYSLVMNAERRLAFYTAVNIDGSIALRLKRETDRWIPDPRIAEDEQTGEDLYAQNDFDRGHLVRRLDPAWGETKQIAKVANDDTFHFTNCSPQHKDFNQGKNLWAGLEDYILDNTDNLDLKVTVFSGPVFRANDEEYRGVRIPKEFWKVVTMTKANGKLSATGYVVSQASLVADIQEADFQFGKFKTFQLPIAKVEQLTGLSFGKLRDFDPLKGGGPQEAAGVTRAISDYGQIVL